MAERLYSKEDRLVMLTYVACYFKTMQTEKSPGKQSTVLLENNANVDEMQNAKMKNGATPLFQAAQQAHADVCTVLLKHNANVNEKWEDGIIPLFQAAWDGFEYICNVLLENNENIKKPRRDNYFHLFNAAQNGHAEMLTGYVNVKIKKWRSTTIPSRVEWSC